jgi:hypothetical protein
LYSAITKGKLLLLDRAGETLNRDDATHLWWGRSVQVNKLWPSAVLPVSRLASLPLSKVSLVHVHRIPYRILCQVQIISNPYRSLALHSIVTMVKCETCQRTFGSRHAAYQHMNAVGHWACESCTDEFSRKEEAEDHMDYYGHRAPHFECETCDDRFYSQEDADEHMDDYDHRLPPFECEACDARFYSPQSARKHMDQMNHWRKHWCSSCHRGFQNGNNLRMVSPAYTLTHRYASYCTRRVLILVVTVNSI